MRWYRLLAPCTLLVACNDPGPRATSGTVMVGSRDGQGVPRMLHARGLPLAAATTPLASARLHAERLASRWGLAVDAMPVLEDVASVPVKGGAIARLRQVIDGLPVYREELRMLVRDTGELVAASGALVGTDAPRAPRVFVDDEPRAIARAVAHTHGRAAAATVRVDQARARQVWYRDAGVLVPAWVVEAYTSHPQATSGDLHRTIIAGDGRVLAHESLVADAAFSYRVFAETSGELRPLDGPTVDATPHPTGIPDGSFPAYIAPSLVTVDGLNEPGDPWLAADATETTGNNVDAYADLSAPTGLGVGDFRATSTGSAFDYTYDTSIGPLDAPAQQQAAITSLFYVINWLHDFWYDAGFTEAAGNAQASNLGRGGVEGDVLLAEAQDNALGGSRNNANMATPDDGMSPRMQVFLWSGRDTRAMTLTPSGRTPAIGGAVFGPRNFTISGPLVLGQDGMGANPTDGCTAYTNDVAGKIVLVDRGNCTFKTKTLNAQTGGALGVIVANNVAGTSPNTLGEDSTITTAITIPSVSVTQDEGATLKQEIAAGAVSAQVTRQVAPELDGSLDATLIAHEFGHYLHHRLSFCSDAMCRALSEGWGDFTALMLLAREGDDLTGVYPFSIYVTQGYAADAGYYGIRRAPYSVDPARNALSYRHMADGEPLPASHPIIASNDNSQVHNAGEVWASALWEVYVALQQAGPQAGRTFAEVRARMAHYVVAGLQMTPIDATPMETRDAILAVALAEAPDDHQVMIEAFARRGFGSCAVAPPASSISFVGLVESTIIAGNPQLVERELIDGCDEDGVLDTGETARLTLRLANQGHAPLTDLSLAVTSQVAGVSVLSAPTTLARLEPFATVDLAVDVALAEGISEPLAGDLALQVVSSGGCQSTVALPVAPRFNVDDVPAAAAVDTFDTQVSEWRPWTIAWEHRRETPLDGHWYGANLAIGSDTNLMSPVLVASETEPVVLSFTHRHSFELSSGIAWDGGVVEYTVDNGVTWLDVATLGAVGYPGSISDESTSPLSQRAAFIGRNPSWPGTDRVTIDLGGALAGETFRVRFRIGTDGGTGDHGWEIDDVEVAGLVNTPFPAQVADDGRCVPDAPIDDPIVSGGGGCCAAGERGGGLSNGLFALLVVTVLRRRSAQQRDRRNTLFGRRSRSR